MNTSAYRKNIRKLMFMLLLVALAGAAYMLVGVNFENQKLFAYAMKIRTPKLIVMLITAFAIGGASIDRDAVSSGYEFAVYTDPHGDCVFCRFRKSSGEKRQCGFCGGSAADGSGGYGGVQLSV